MTCTSHLLRLWYYMQKAKSTKTLTENWAESCPSHTRKSWNIYIHTTYPQNLVLHREAKQRMQNIKEKIGQSPVLHIYKKQEIYTFTPHVLIISYHIEKQYKEYKNSNRRSDRVLSFTHTERHETYTFTPQLLRIFYMETKQRIQA